MVNRGEFLFIAVSYTCRENERGRKKKLLIFFSIEEFHFYVARVTLSRLEKPTSDSCRNTK
jgi:hypothetical protein